MRKLSLHILEEHFANDFSSPVFILLADRYYHKKQYKRAEKVCFIGLERDSNNYIGIYILAKIHLINNKLKKAEKLLTSVVNNDVNNINALITLIEVSIKLNRSHSTYEKYIERVHCILPNDVQFKSMYNKILKRNKPLISSSKKEATIKDRETIYINDKMATKTMYKLMMKQNKNEIAKQILLMMKTNKKNLKFVNVEFKKHI